MNTRHLPIGFFNLVSFTAGFVASVPVLSAGVVYLMERIDGMDALALMLAVGAISTLALLCGVGVRTCVLALLASIARGPDALDWCTPSECVSFAAWLGCTWGFPGKDGWQEGLRVCGLGIALRGTHGQEAAHG